MAHLQISCSLLTPSCPTSFMLGKCPYLNNLITRLRTEKVTHESNSVYSVEGGFVQYKLIFQRVRFDSIVARWHKSPSGPPPSLWQESADPGPRRSLKLKPVTEASLRRASVSLHGTLCDCRDRQGEWGVLERAEAKSPSHPFKLHWSKENFRREWMRVLIWVNLPRVGKAKPGSLSPSSAAE